MGRKRLIKKLFAFSTSLCLILSTTSFTFNGKTLSPNRIKGRDRFDTAVEIAENVWSGEFKHSTNAILASGNNANLVDALAVAPLAYKLKAPILLDDNDKDFVNYETLRALKNNGVKTVYVASGSGVISNKAVYQLEDAGMRVVRLGGDNRYETCRNIYDEFMKLGGDDDTVALVSGSSLADALSIAPIAARQEMPILLTKDKYSVARELKDIAYDASKVYVVGGSGVISSSLVNKLDAVRLGGDNRYDTNAEVINEFEEHGKVKFDNVYFAYGADSNLVDALTGSVLAACNQAPVVLTNNKLYSMKSTRYMLEDNLTSESQITSFGGIVTNDFLYDVAYINEDNKTDKYVSVDSIDALNLKQIEIEFDEDIDEDEAVDIDNYEIENEDGHDVEIDNITYDDRVALITFKDTFKDDKDGAEFGDYPVDNQEKIKVTVDKNLINSKDDYVKEFEVVDLKLPRVVDVEVNGINTIKVKFSEPMKPVSADFNSDGKVEKLYADEDAFEVLGEDDSKYYVRSVELVNNNTEANVKLYSDLDDDDYVKIKVNGKIEDYAEYGAVGGTFEADVREDNEEPYVEDYENALKNEVTLIFNEDVEANGALSTSVRDGITYYDDFYHTNSRNKAIDVDIIGKKVTLTFDKENSLPPGTAYIHINDGALKDLWNNENDNITFRVEREVDTTKPTVIKVEQGSTEREINVTFSENVDEDTALDKKNYVLKDDDGDKVKIKRVELKDDDEVKITTYDDLSGYYTLYVEDVQDLSGNVMDDEDYEFYMKDKTAPILSKNAKAYFYNAGNRNQVIVVDFGEEMLADGSNYAVDNIDNYRIVGKAYDRHGNLVRISKDLCDFYDADIDVIDDGTKIEIQLPFDDDESNSYSFSGSGVDIDLQIARVKDAADNKTVDFASDIHVYPQDFVAFDSSNPPKATDTNKIVITFNDKLDFDEDDLKICTDNKNLRISGIKTSLNDSSNTVVTYTLASMDALNYDGTYGNNHDNVYVKATGYTKSNNRYGATLNPNMNPQLVSDGIAPKLKTYGKGEKDSEGYSIEGEDIVESYKGYIELYFEEPIDNRTVSTMCFEVEDYDVVSATSLDSNGHDSNVVTLKLNKNTTPPEGTEVTQKAAIRDVHYNVVKDIDTEVSKNVEAIKREEQEKKAEEAVKKAEESKTLEDYNAAKALVDALEDGAVKTDLLNRLQEVKKIIDYNNSLNEAKAALQNAINDAKKVLDSAVPTPDTSQGSGEDKVITVGTYAQADIDALNKSISDAEAVYENEKATLDEVNNATAKLNSDVEAFKGKVVKAEVTRVDLTPSTINIVASNEVNKNNSIAVDEATGDYSISFKATVKDQDGTALSGKKVTFSASYDDQNGTKDVAEINKKLSISEDGVLKVKKDAVDGKIIVKAITKKELENGETQDIVGTSQVIKDVTSPKAAVAEGSTKDALTLTFNEPLYKKDSNGNLVKVEFNGSENQTSVDLMKLSNIPFKVEKLEGESYVEVPNVIVSAVYTPQVITETSTTLPKIVFTFAKDESGNSKIINGCRIVCTGKFYDALGNELTLKEDGVLITFTDNAWK